MNGLNAEEIVIVFGKGFTDWIIFSGKEDSILAND